MPAEQAASRLTRLLAMMSYLAERDAVPVAELASQFGVTETQVLRDVDLLWVSGVPGYYPQDLIDFSVDDYARNIISLRDSQGLDQPVPLAAREALALTAAVEWLRGSGVADERTLRVLEAVQAKLHGIVPAELTVAPPEGAATRAALSRAIAEQGHLEIEYVSAEDHRSRRVVAPLALHTDGAAWYLDAWCHLARGERTFRVDRILSLSPAPAPAGVPETAATATAPTDVVLLLARGARWVAEDLPDARLADVMVAGRPCVEVRLAMTRTDWLVRLLLSVGSQVVSVSPAALEEELRSRAAAALAAYRDPALASGAADPRPR